MNEDLDQFIQDVLDEKGNWIGFQILDNPNRQWTYRDFSREELRKTVRSVVAEYIRGPFV